MKGPENKNGKFLRKILGRVLFHVSLLNIRARNGCIFLWFMSEERSFRRAIQKVQHVPRQVEVHCGGERGGCGEGWEYEGTARLAGTPSYGLSEVLQSSLQTDLDHREKATYILPKRTTGRGEGISQWGSYGMDCQKLRGKGNALLILQVKCRGPVTRRERAVCNALRRL